MGWIYGEILCLTTPMKSSRVWTIDGVINADMNVVVVRPKYREYMIIQILTLRIIPVLFSQ